MDDEEVVGGNVTGEVRKPGRPPPYFLAICAILGTFILAGLFLPDRSKTRSADGVPVLDQAAAVFQGGYTRQQIKRLLDEVMAVHGVPQTESHYDVWTNVLVQMRLDGGGTEMEILRCMKAMGTTVGFPANAGICAAGKRAGLR